MDGHDRPVAVREVLACDLGRDPVELLTHDPDRARIPQHGFHLLLHRTPVDLVADARRADLQLGDRVAQPRVTRLAAAAALHTVQELGHALLVVGHAERASAHRTDRIERDPAAARGEVQPVRSDADLDRRAQRAPNASSRRAAASASGSPPTSRPAITVPAGVVAAIDVPQPARMSTRTRRSTLRMGSTVPAARRPGELPFAGERCTRSCGPGSCPDRSCARTP